MFRNMSYAILFCIFIGYIGVDSTAAIPNPYVQLLDGGERQNQQISSGCEVCGEAFVNNNTKLVVDGNIVRPPNKYPWVVQMVRTGENETHCAGAIINENFILTAAHCLESLGNEDIQIIFLSNSTDNIKKGKRFPVAQFFSYPKFNMTHSHDIGLIKMKEPIQCSEFANPICLPPRSYRQPIGSVVRINGWGATMDENDNSTALKEAEIRVIDGENCTEGLKGWNDKYDICLSGEGKQGPCHGDSGGSMITEMDNKYFTTGVTSQHSSYRCDTDFPVVYTSVSAHMDWITEVTGMDPSK